MDKELNESLNSFSQSLSSFCKRVGKLIEDQEMSLASPIVKTSQFFFENDQENPLKSINNNKTEDDFLQELSLNQKENVDIKAFFPELSTKILSDFEQMRQKLNENVKKIKREERVYLEKIEKLDPRPMR